MLRASSAGLLALVSASAFAGAAAEGAAAQGAVATLRLLGELRCEPAHPVFCSNIHVSCAGPTRTPTFPFVLRTASGSGSIESSAETSGIAEQYQGGRAEWDDAGGYVIVRPRQGAGYIKVLADGTFSFRHYAAAEGAMARGHCR